MRANLRFRHQRGPSGVAAILLSAFVSLSPAHSQTATNATIEVQCSGGSGARVAIRWSHPDYSSANPFMPLWTVPCRGAKASKQLRVTARNSEFEIQTEGGLRTVYGINVSVAGQNGGTNNISIIHTGSRDPIVMGGRVTLARSSGPNKYGEQNFRVAIPPGKVANVRIQGTVTGDQPGAQAALRWGHPDFHDNEYFGLLTMKPQPAVAWSGESFQLRDPNSEFEIQTEGGQGTSYTLAFWFDFADGSPPSTVWIEHQRPGTHIAKQTRDVTFTPSGAGNIYGELNVRTSVPWLRNRAPALTVHPRLSGAF